MESLVLLCFRMVDCDFGAVRFFGVWERFIVAFVVEGLMLGCFGIVFL